MISSPVSNLPCTLTEEHIPSAAFAAANMDGGEVQDLRFSSDEDGNTELYYDDISFDPVAETAQIKVRVPLLASSTDTTIYGWIGNASATAPSAAWKQNTYPSAWEAFWSISEGEGTTVGDRTGNGNDGTMQNMDPATDWVAGPNYGYALDFDGSNDRIDVPVSWSIREHTIVFWLDWDDYGSSTVGFICESEFYDKLMVHTGGAAGTNGLRHNSSGANSAQIAYTGIIASGWNQYAVKYDGTEASGYRNGTFDSGANRSWAEQGLSKFSIGARDDGRYPLDGRLASMSVHADAVSSDELSALHLMTSDPATWATAGEVEDVGVSFEPRRNHIHLLKPRHSVHIEKPRHSVHVEQPRHSIHLRSDS